MNVYSSRTSRKESLIRSRSKSSTVKMLLMNISKGRLQQKERVKGAERERQRERETERQRERQRETERDLKEERETERFEGGERVSEVKWCGGKQDYYVGKE